MPKRTGKFPPPSPFETARDIKLIVPGTAPLVRHKSADPIKTIIFDWGKTIHDYHLDILFDWLSRKFGIPRHYFWDMFSRYPGEILFPYECGQSTKKFIERFREESEKLCRDFKIRMPVISDEEFIEYWNMVIDLSPPLKERVGLLRKLKAKGYKIYVLSNTNEAHVEYFKGSERCPSRFIKIF